MEQDTSSKPPVNTQMPVSNNSNKLVIILGVVLLLVFVAFISFILGVKSQRPTPEIMIKPSSTPLPPEILPTKQVVTDPMADWKTYTNKIMGFSIKIPSDETVTESASTQDVVFATLDKLGLVIANHPPSIGDPIFRKLIKTRVIQLPSGESVEISLSQLGKSPSEKDGLSDTYEVGWAQKSVFTSKYYINDKMPSAVAEADFDEIAQILSTFTPTK